MLGKGKSFALVSGGLSVVVLAAFLAVSRDRIREEWWIYRLSSSRPGVQERAIRTLAGMRTSRAIEALVRNRENKEALGALVEIGRRGLTAVLREAKAAVHVVDFPRGVPVLTECLSDPDGDIRFWALDSIARMPSTDRLPPATREAVQAIVAEDPDSRCRIEAAVLLSWEESTRIVRQRLLEGLRSDDPELRERSILLLPNVGPEPLLAGSYLPLLWDPDQKVRSCARAAFEEHLLDLDLCRYLGDSVGCLGSVLSRWRDPGAKPPRTPARAAAKVVAHLGDREQGPSVERALLAAGPAAVPVLIEALRKDDVRVTYRAARVLGASGPGARDAAPALRAVLPGCDPILGAVVEDALRRIEDRGGSSDGEERK